MLGSHLITPGWTSPVQSMICWVGPVLLVVHVLFELLACSVEVSVGLLFVCFRVTVLMLEWRGVVVGLVGMFHTCCA